MELKDTIPFNAIQNKFPSVRTDVIADSITSILKVDPNLLTSTLLYIWDEMVERKLVKDPYKIGPYAYKERELYGFVKNELGREPITDGYYVKYYNDIHKKNAFAVVALLQCFPDDVHINDVVFLDNSSPIDNDEERQFHGLHIFSEFLNNVKALAKERSLRRISLMVAYPSLYGFFKKYGFVLSNSEKAQLAYNAGMGGFPMILAL